jgi:hypothetical protein
MFIPFSLLLGTSLLLAGGDTVKKKAPEKGRPAPKPSGIVQTGAPVSSPTGKTPMIGKAIERSLVSTARSVAPRASYLSSVIRSRASRGPELPPGIRPNPNNVSFTADSIVVEKSRRTMTLYSQGSPVRIYFVALGGSPVGAKMSIGDNRTPEGVYYIEGHNPASKYHLSLRVSYPNEQDIAQARARGVATGGDIMIHGLPHGFENVGAEHRQRDWTNGCIAVTNAEIEEIWSAIPDGVVIYIKP